MKETRSTWRIYAKQWVFDSRHASHDAALSHALDKYGERLDPEEYRASEDDLDGSTWVLWTHRWSVLAESKYEEFAFAYAQACMKDFDLPEEYVKVIERNSRAEHELLQHGVLKKAQQNG
jgi:hypothetical protein